MSPSDPEAPTDEPDVEAHLALVDFDPEATFLTRRQAEVLVLRERGLTQAAIADRLGTTRANVAGIEASARENVAKARETVAVADRLAAPVRVAVPSGTELYDVPDMVFDASDAAGIKVTHDAPALLKVVSDAAGDAVVGRVVREDLVVHVTTDGAVRVTRSA
ncbi:MAG: Tfx family DNA-binding protein [Halobacteriota archaeon]